MPTEATLLNAALLALAVSMVVVLLLYGRLYRRGSRLRASLDAANLHVDTLLQRDRLTGLQTRADFERLLEEAALACDHAGGRLCVLYLGLDNFRLVNEAYGHESGDALLRQAAERLATCIDDGPLARIAGDEFALIAHEDIEGGRRVALQLLQAINRPLQMANQELRLTCSIGIAAYPQHGSRPRLVAHAGAAMRCAKLSGGGAHAEYEPSMGVDMREQAQILSDLRVAVERRQLELVYQPKIDARSLQVTAAEALLRWHHPQRGVVSPAVFIPVAERHGLIGAIGDWVIEEACRQAAEWRTMGLRMRVAVNLSGYQMRQHDLVDRIEQSLARHRIVPSRFTCEITESVAMEDTRITQQAFERLGRAGVHVSIDDFGTGYSSLASLRRLPAAELKIDRAFVSDLASSADARSIASAIVQMAHTLELRVVAEGVETEAQRDLLVAMGCDELQGFLFAKPMSAKSLALWASDEEPEEDGMFRASLFEETAAAPLSGA